MENSNDLASRFSGLYLDGKWIANTNYKEQLGDITWQEATHKIGSLNTIAALAFHVNYYLAGLLHFFETGKLEIRDKYSFDLPEIQGNEDWEKLREALVGNAEKFAATVSGMPAEKLEAVFVDEKYGNYRRNIEGVIEHGYYHLGQISLIKKMVREAKS